MLKALKDIELMYDGQRKKVKAGTVFNASELFGADINLDAHFLSKSKDMVLYTDKPEVVKPERPRNVSNSTNNNRRSRRASSRRLGA